MKRVCIVVIGLLVVVEVRAITWDFEEDGDTQGWRAEYAGGSSSDAGSLPSGVESGAWRIALTTWSVQLVSPIIEQDSKLFDRLTVRYRLVGGSSFVGSAGLFWTNAHNRDFPGGDPLYVTNSGMPSRFWLLILGVEYGPSWTTLAFSDLRSRGVILPGLDYESEILWEDELVDVRVRLGPSRSDEQVELQIDRITLTGVEEMLQGEVALPVPQVPAAFGSLFAPAAFVPLGQIHVGIGGTASARPGALGDLDADGFPDMVAVWGTPEADGWLYALGDGTGSFGQAVTFQRSTLPTLWSSDMNGDGLHDMVLSEGFTAHTYLSDPETLPGVFEHIQTTDDLLPLGMANANGDGYPDMWFGDFTDGAEAAVLGRNDGTGHLQLQRVGLPRPREGFQPYMLFARSIGAMGVDGVVWGAMDAPQAGLEVTFLTPDGEVGQLHLPLDLPPDLLRYIGDLDGDGDLDLLVSTQAMLTIPPRHRGMRCLLGEADGAWVEHALSEDVEVAGYPTVADLNSDGLLDVAFTDGTQRYPALIVALGQQHSAPAMEGRYPLAGSGGAVLAGDLDDDSDVDLVVLERSVGGQGGAHVLLNQLARHVTAVTGDLTPEGAASTGRQVVATALTGAQLHPAYPNPFNPQTVIAFTMPHAAQSVQLRIHNVIGQPVRALVNGPLGEGVHRVIWDGLDDRGIAVPSGVYFYQLSVDGVSTGRKIVRLE